MELHSLDIILLMPDTHNCAIRQLCGNLQTIRQTFPLDDQGMIASNLNALRKPCIETFSHMLELRYLAMDDFPGPHDFCTKYLADCLMTKTDAEDWQLTLHPLDQFFRDACILRYARTWREHDSFIVPLLDLLWCDLIVADDFNLSAQLCKYLIYIIGKRIIII